MLPRCAYTRRFDIDACRCFRFRAIISMSDALMRAFFDDSDVAAPLSRGCQLRDFPAAFVTDAAAPLYFARCQRLCAAADALLMLMITLSFC